MQKIRQDFVAWHGSPHDFGKFDFSRLRDDLGVFFAEDKEHAERYGYAREYCLSFKNLLRVRQGREYAETLSLRPGERGGLDVRRRLLKAGHDGVRIEYDGGAVDYVAFSNRNIRQIWR